MTGSEETLKIGGKAVQLFTGGEGPPLLYLHGAGTYWWMPVHDLLGARHRVYAPVHPGFGASEGLDEIESMEDLVFHAVDVLDALGLERVGRRRVVARGLAGGRARAAASGPRGSARAGGRGGDARAGRGARGSVHGIAREGAAAPVRRSDVGPGGGAGARRAARPSGSRRRCGGGRPRRGFCGTRTCSTGSSRAGSGGSRRRPSSCGGRRIACCRWRWARPISAASPGPRLTTIEGCGHLPPLEAPERFARHRARLPSALSAPEETTHAIRLLPPDALAPPARRLRAAPRVGLARPAQPPLRSGARPHPLQRVPRPARRWPSASASTSSA